MSIYSGQSFAPVNAQTQAPTATGFLEQVPFIIFFLIMCLGITVTAGTDALTIFLFLVLLSMLVVNSKKVSLALNKFIP